MAEVTYQDINQVLTDIVNRIRSLESKYNLLGERLLIVNQNVISQFKKDNVEFKTINAELKEIQRELEDCEISIASEMTKIHELIYHGNISGHKTDSSVVKGEYVVMI